jgi:hypothetical protein
MLKPMLLQTSVTSPAQLQRNIKRPRALLSLNLVAAYIAYGCAIAQAVSRRLVIVEDRACAQVSPCRICIIPPLLHIHSCFIWELDKGPVRGRSSTETVSPLRNYNKNLHRHWRRDLYSVLRPLRYWFRISRWVQIFTFIFMEENHNFLWLILLFYYFNCNIYLFCRICID